MIYPILHPTYNERHKKIIEMIYWTLERYRDNMENAQLNEEQIIISKNIFYLGAKTFYVFV